jgi:hypothetical protein
MIMYWRALIAFSILRGCGMKSLTAIASMMVDLASDPETVRLMLAGLLSGARDHAPLCVGEIGLVSDDGAAMLLSSSRRPHDESQVGSRNPLESRRVDARTAPVRCKSWRETTTIASVRVAVKVGIDAEYA